MSTAADESWEDTVTRQERMLSGDRELRRLGEGPDDAGDAEGDEMTTRQADDTYRRQLADFYRQAPDRRDSLSPTGALSLMSLALAEALAEHADALANATRASDGYADHLVGVTRRLGWATWALVGVAAVEIIVTWWWGHS